MQDYQDYQDDWNQWNVDHDRGRGLQLASKLLMVRGRDGSLQPLNANRAQMLFESNRERHNIVLKARQMGMTTWIAGRFLLKTLKVPGSLTVLAAHTRDAAESIFSVVERMWANLPRPLRRGEYRRSRANAGQMVFPRLDSEFRIVSAAEENAGRGLTIQNLHLSEVARWCGDASGTLAGLRAALSPTGEMTLESTPSGAYGVFYEEWQRAIEPPPEGRYVGGTVRHFLPWWTEPAYIATAATGLNEEERALMQRHGLTAQQIGFRRTLETGFRGLRAQEYAEDPVTCFKATGGCCFEIATVEERLRRVPAPLGTRRNGALRIWLPPLPGKQYLVSVDTAGGGSDGDYAAIQVIELATGLQCAELREHMGPLELAHAAASLAEEYGRATIAVERNNHGAAVLAYLEAVERYPSLYEQHGTAGWLTSAASRPAMVSRLGALLAEQPELFYSQRLLEECRTFITQPGGKTGAAHGAHDDCLMAMAIAQAVRAERLGRR